MLQQSSPFFRFLALVTLLTFFPSSVAVWNFIPPDYFEAVAQEADGASTPERAEKQETLDEHFVLASNRRPIVSFAELERIHGEWSFNQSALVAKDGTVDAASIQPGGSPVTDLAQLQPSLSNALVTQLQAQGQIAEDVTARLATVEELHENGDYLAAVVECLELMDDYGDPAVRKLTMDRIDRIEADVVNGRVPMAAIEDMIQNLPAVAEVQSVPSRYLLTGFSVLMGDHMEAAGDTASALAFRQKVIEDAWLTLQNDQNHPFQVHVLQMMTEAGTEGDHQTYREVRNHLDNLKNQESGTLVQAFATCALAEYKRALGGDYAGARLLYRQFIENFPQGAVSAALADPYLQDWIKEEIEYYTGTAFLGLRDYENALLWFDEATSHAKVGPYGRLAAYKRTRAAASLFPGDPNALVDQLYQFIQSFPNSEYAPQGLLDMASVYAAHENHDEAVDRYRQVIQQYPKSDAAKSAATELEYLHNNVLGTYEDVAANTLADRPWCGPLALANLLSLSDISTTVEELAVLAGTDASGTTMLGLVEAAKAKGIHLRVIETSQLSDVRIPFIAHLDEGHFLLVSELSEDAVVVRDGDPAQSIPVERKRFEDAWSGKALAFSAREEQPSQQELALLRNTKGGHFSGFGWFKDKPDDEDDLCYDKCGCDPDGSGHGVGTGECGGSGSDTNGSSSGSPTFPLGYASPGVSPVINSATMGLYLVETDLSIPVRGNLRLTFQRTYTNDTGYHPDTFTDVTKPYSNIIGDGWTHNFNVQIRSSSATDPTTSTWYGRRGIPVEYQTVEDSCSAPSPIEYGHAIFRPSTAAHSGDCMFRDSSENFELRQANGMTWTCLPPSGSDNYSRPTQLEAGNGQTITLAYDGPNAVGKLTKVTGPASEYTLNLTYDGNLITKVELKKGGALLEDVEYEYNVDNELTKVTDGSGKTVTYTYGSDGNAPASRYISSIADKAGRTVDLTWTFANDGSGTYVAQKVVADLPNGLVQEISRSVSTGVATYRALDGDTELRKETHTPVTGDYARTLYKDIYTNTSTYKRWTYEYNADGLATKLVGPGSATHWTRTWDASYRLTSSQRPGATATTFAYASGRFATKITDSAGLETLIGYNGSGQINSVQPPQIPGGITYLYDGFGQVTILRRTAGGTDYDTDYAYDGFGRMTSMTDANGNTTSRAYDDHGNVVQVTDPRSKSTYFYYDTGGCGSCSGGSVLTKVKDALNEETLLYYDGIGNLTTVTDALSHSVDYEYDAMNRLTKVEDPAGGATSVTLEYDLLGNLTKTTDQKGEIVTRTYDWLGQLESSTDDVESISVTYTNTGQVSTVTDGLSHTWTYAYDSGFRLISITDPISKVVKYAYDSAGRMTKVGAGSSGTFDPTQYFFSTATGMLSKVRYTSGEDTHDANYFYDGLARLTKLTDWIDGTDGLRYGYDDGGRLTTITDYDDSTLTYAYDAAGNVTSMTDYHDNTTTYTYTDRNELSTLTAPGSKTWTFHYNDIGQPTYYNIPNGMTTNYGYDSRNRLTTIEHKDGANVLDGFAYALDDMGNISTTTHEDGSFWEYAYDGRYRLTSAVRKNPNETIEATYAYTYDAGDNLLTKVEPFEDDFNDGNYTGWTVTSGSWTAANNYMEATHATSTNVIRKAHTDADNEIVLRYRINDTSSNSAKASIHCRHVDGSNLIAVEIQPDRLRLVENVSGTGTVQDLNTSATSSEDVWYNLRIEAVGGDVTVWRWADGELAAQVLEMTGATIDTTSTCLIAVNPSYDYDFDDIRILSDDLSNTTTFAVNNSNELTAMADYNGSTTFGFDDWGRMTSKARGSYEATYAYRYGQMLRSVTSDFPGEGNVTYEYGGNGKRRQSIVSGSTTNYNWSGGRAIINIEDGSGNLTRTFIGHLRAHVDGSSPSTADYVYYSNDIIYTSRTMRGESRELLGQSEYDPYGGTLLHVGTSSSRGYTGQITDHETGLVLAPIRAYNAELARWLSRDTRQFAPANLYGYVGNSPVAFMDPMGWDAKGPEDYVHPEDVDVCANAWEASRMWPNPWKFKDKVRTGGDWDFKQRSPDERFEDFGNWHYGVVCRAWRFSRARCKKEAGRNHEERRKREGLPPLDGADRESGKLTPPNYGDDPNDQKNIDEGMDWFEEGNCDDYFERKLWEKMPDLIDGGWGR